MVGRKTKLRFRRSIRKRRKQAVELSSATESGFERYIYRRLMRLFEVRRFVLGWVGLIMVLSIGVVLQTRALAPYYTQTKPVSGGTYREGIIGNFTNANPIYAQNEVDSSASRLVFSGLFKYNVKGELVPDLAEKITIDKTETIYTVKLKPNLKWHDGQPLTSKDVVFTFNTIQNPEAKSYLQPSWKGVTIKAVDESTIKFTLSNALSSFPHSLVSGIIPEHILAQVEPTQLRSSTFNNQIPVGSGPFKFQAVEVDSESDGGNARIAFEANKEYHGGAPQLERFIIRTYADEESLTKAFDNSEVDAMLGIDTLADDIDSKNIRTAGIPLAGEVMVFFKNSNPILKDKVVREALVLGIDKKEAFQTLSYPVLSVDEPLLRSHVGYDNRYAQVTNKKEVAKAKLTAAGWKVDKTTGIRANKAGKPLKFRLFSSSSSEFTSITGNLQKQWRDLGVEVEVVLQPENELQTTVSSHNYDALMYGILLGADPDVYAYWHSSQGDIRSQTRLNLSEYKSAIADKSLEAGRTRSDEANRVIKYRPFLKVWQADNPALALYQPQFLYLTTSRLSGFEYGVAQSSADRYNSVTNWKIRNAPQKIQE